MIPSDPNYGQFLRTSQVRLRSSSVLLPKIKSVKMNSRKMLSSHQKKWLRCQLLEVFFGPSSKFKYFPDLFVCHPVMKI